MSKNLMLHRDKNSHWHFKDVDFPRRQNAVSILRNITPYCHGAHTREKQEHADEDLNSNYSL